MNLRKFAVGLLVVLGILLAAGLLWIESSAFDRWAQRKAVEYARARWNLQVQLQKLHIQVWRQRATVDALSVRRVQDPRPIFRADRVTIEFRVYDLLTPSVDLKEIVAESPEVWIQPEEPGGPGLSSWLWQEASPAKRRLFDLAVGAIRLQEGTLHYGDIRHRLQIASRGLRWRMNFVPQRDLYRIQMALRDTDLSYDQADYRGVQIQADLDWYRQKLEFRDLKLESSVLQATGRGVLEHPGEARYRFDVSGKIRLAHVPLRYRKGLPTAGEVQFEGELSGEGSDYLLRSSLVSPRMELSKFIVEDFRSSLKVRKGQMVLESLVGRLFQGRLQGRLQVDLAEADRPGALPASSFHYELKGGELRQALRTWIGKDLGARAAFFSKGVFRWPGTAFDRARGEGEASFDGTLEVPRTQVSPHVRHPHPTPERLLAIQGKVEFAQGRELFDLRNSSISTPGAHVDFSGTVTGGGSFDLGVRLDAQHVEEVLDVARAAGLDLEAVPQTSFFPFETARFEGRISRLDRFIRGRGRISLAELIYRGENWGTLTGLVEFDPRAVSMQDARLQLDAGQVRFQLHYLLGEKRGNLTAKLSGIPVQKVLGTLKMDYPLSGSLSGSAQIRNFPGEAEGTARLQLLDGSAWGEPFQEVESDLYFDQQVVEARSLAVIKAEGSIKGTAKLDPQHQWFQVRLQGRQFPVSGIRRLGGQELQLRGLVSFDLDGSGNWQQPHFRLTASTPLLSVRGERLRNLRLEADSDSRRARFRLATQHQEHRLDMDGHVELRDSYPLEATVRFRDVSLTALIEAYYNKVRTQEARGIPRGLVTGQVVFRAQLNPQRLLGAQAVLDRLALFADQTRLQNPAPLRISLENQTVNFQDFKLTGAGGEFTANGLYRLGPQGRHSLQLVGSMDAASLNLLYPNPLTGGKLRMDAVVTGTAAVPQIVGEARLEDGDINHPALPVAIYDAEGKIRFTRNQVRVESFQGRTIHGGFTLRGNVLLKGLQAERWFLTLEGNRLRARYPAGFHTLVDADLSVIGSRESTLIRGTVRAQSSEYKEEVDLAGLALSIEREIAAQPPVEAIQHPFLVDVAVTADKTIHVHNNLAEAWASADLRIQGTLARPIPMGRITAQDGGKFVLQNNKYTVERANFTFLDPVRINPMVDLEASTEVREYTIFLQLKGTFDRLTTSIRSEPPLSTVAIVNLLSTRELPRSAVEIDPHATQIQTATAPSLLTQALAGRLQQRAQQFLGIDQFTVDPFLVGTESNPAARVTISKEVTSRLNITYSTSLASKLEDVIIVEYALSDRVTVIGTRNETGDYGIDFRFKKRF